MKMRGTGRALIVRATLFLLLAATACAQKIQTGYDKSADFSQYKTYAWIPRATPATNPAMAAIIDQNIEYELNQKGLHKVDGNADLLVQSYGGAGGVEGGYAPADPSYTATGGYPVPGTTMWGGSLPATRPRRSCMAQLRLTWSTPGASSWCGAQPPRAKWITTSAANCWSRPTRPYRKCSKNTRRQNDPRLGVSISCRHAWLIQSFRSAHNAVSN